MKAKIEMQNRNFVLNLVKKVTAEVDYFIKANILERLLTLLSVLDLKPIH